MSGRGASVVRCIADGVRVRVRVGRRGWVVAGRADAALASMTDALPTTERERFTRCAPSARIAILAARTALMLVGADAAVAAGRVLLRVHAVHGSEDADRAFWRTADPVGGGLASPQRFAATLPSAVAGDVALVLGLRGPAFVTTGPSARGRGAPWAPRGFIALADVLLDLTVDATTSRALAVSVRFPSDARPAGSLGGVRCSENRVNGGET
ncbi:MAG: hypothetical protein K8T90_00795 [Planctomycetes bacterium]|nr:hypothetical protein [Planctomycetota bacterium]